MLERSFLGRAIKVQERGKDVVIAQRLVKSISNIAMSNNQPIDEAQHNDSVLNHPIKAADLFANAFSSGSLL